MLLRALLFAHGCLPNTCCAIRSDPNPNATLPAEFAAWCTAKGHAGKPGW